MDWGNSLLFLGDIADFVASGLSSIVYHIGNLLGSALYLIWRGLAWLVSLIESLFRNLAGLGTGEHSDMVGEIVNNKQVQIIFWNLVGFSTALIVFFTIVKILQDHYKEKDGGNPYKIVIRTFKGLLMFYFVGAAVTVGLYASQVMFRALDSATGGGTKTNIAGVIFKAMAADANRSRIGYCGEDELFDQAKNKYWKRVADPAGTTDDGKYMIVEVTDDGKAKTTKALAQKYFDLFPSMRYGIVGSDGKSVTPLARWMNTQENWVGDTEYGDSAWDKYWQNVGTGVQEGVNNNFNWSNEYAKDPEFVNNFEESGDIYGSAGYKNDLLQSFDVSIQPTIDLKWSPVDIYNFGYTLEDAGKIDFDTNVTVLGTGILIKMSLQYGKYGEPVITMKSLEDTAKKFGISIKGKAALEGDEASASFSVDAFQPSMFEMLFKTITVNVIYSNLAEQIVQFIPKFPAQLNIGPVSTNFMALFGGLITSIMETLVNESMGLIIPKNADGKPTVDAFVMNPSSHNGDVWFSVNTKSQYMPVVIQRYQIDGNFADLWSQLMDNYNQFLDQLQSTNDMTWSKAAAQSDVMKQMEGEVVNQNGWMQYKAKVDEFNNMARSKMTNLGSCLALWEKVSVLPEGERAAALGAYEYDGSFADLESEIKSSYISIVQFYNDNIRDAKPTVGSGSNVVSADPRITVPIYKPILEFRTSNQAAESYTVPKILQSLISTNDANSKMRINMLLDDAGQYSERTVGYRMVDWGVYGMVEGIRDWKYADIYNTNKIVVKQGDKDVPAIYENTSLNNLGFADLAASSSEPLDQGWQYFLDRSNEYGLSNDFVTRSTSHGTDITLKGDAYWGAKGICMDNKVHGDWQTSRPLGVEDTAVTRASSAQSNVQILDGYQATQKEINTLADVDTTSSLATEFSKNIVTFRKILPSADDKDKKPDDKKTLKDWIKNSNTVAINGGSTINALHSMTAEQIDDYMIATSGRRRYLVLSKKGTTLPVAESLGSYVGSFSFNNPVTVNALYDYGSMNFVVGFIGIIVAASVYMNFAFGLIQRAVNMAVLYVLSPITIAFYPFDDGSRFSSQFVKPFYQEAISAFAVIVSLNLFVVLLDPTINAVRAVMNNDVVGWFMQWLAVVSVVSMLPRVRDMVTSVLGAGKLTEKRLGDVLKDANKSLGNIGGKTAKVAGAAYRGYMRTKLHSEANRNEEIKRLEGLKNDNKLGWWGQRKLDKLKGIDASQKRIDEARATNDKSKLTARDLRRMNKQERVAANEASKLKRLAGESDQDYQKRVTARKNALLADPKFTKSVNGIVTGSKVGRGMGQLVNASGKLFNTVKDSKLGSTVGAMGKKVKNSLVGEMVRDQFGINGRLVEEGKTTYGKFMRLFNPKYQERTLNSMARKERADRSYTNAYKEPLYKGFSENAKYYAEGNAVMVRQAKKVVARNQMANSTKDTKAKLQDLLAVELLQQGKDVADAQAEAQARVSQMTAKNAKSAYIKLGGDEKYADGLAKELQEFKVLGLGLDFSKLDKELGEAEKYIRTNFMKGGKGEITKRLNDEQAKQTADLKNYTAQMANALGKNDAASQKTLERVLGKADINTSFADLSQQIKKELKIDNLDDVKNALGANYADFAKNVQFNQEVDALKAALEAQSKFDKGDSEFNNKMGPYVSKTESAAMLNQFRKVNDTNYNSIDPESLGYQTNQIIQEYKDKGGLKNPECRAKVEKLSKSMQDALFEQMEVFGRKNAEAIREHDIAAKYNQEMNAVETMSMITTYQDQREKIISEQMDVPTVSLIVNDGLITRMHDEGDYAGSGRMIQQLLDCVERHDEAGAYALDFDDKTVETIMKWSDQGQTKRLEGLRTLAEFDTAHMGSVLSDMGGSSLAGYETALAYLTSYAEKKIMTEKIDTAITSFSSQETEARNAVQQVLKSIPTTFTGKIWDGLLGKIKDLSGNAVTNQEELQSALIEQLNAVHDEKVSSKDPRIQATLTALADFQAENPNNYAIANAVDNFSKYGIGSADNANDRSRMVMETRDVSSTLKGQSQDIWSKIKPFMEGK